MQSLVHQSPTHGISHCDACATTNTTSKLCVCGCVCLVSFCSQFENNNVIYDLSTSVRMANATNFGFTFSLITINRTK